MRPTSIPPYSVVVSEIEKRCKESFSTLLETHYEQMSTSTKNILSKGYKVIMWTLMITIIIGPIMYLIRNLQIRKINNLIKDEIGNEKIYATALEGTDICEVTGSGKIPNNIHFQLRVPYVPSDARIIKSFDGLKGTTSKKTDMLTNAVKFRWVRHGGSGSQVYYYTQAMMIIGCDFMEEFEFDLKRENLFSKISGREKKKLESRVFEKTFSIKNNDEVKLRQSFTPMIQENYVKYNNEKKLRSLKMVKVGNLLYVVWGSRDDYLSVKGRKLNSTSLEDIIEMIWKNVKKDLSEFYTASAYGTSLPFYKEDKITHQGDLESEQTHEKIKKGFIATVLANQ